VETPTQDVGALLFANSGGRRVSQSQIHHRIGIHISRDQLHETDKHIRMALLEVTYQAEVIGPQLKIGVLNQVVNGLALTNYQPACRAQYFRCNEAVESPDELLPSTDPPPMRSIDAQVPPSI
jgi:hypothetical protein